MLKCNFEENMSLADCLNAAMDILGHVKCAMPVSFVFNGIEFVLKARHENIVTPRIYTPDNGLASISDEAICYQYFSRLAKSEDFRRIAEEHLHANIKDLFSDL